MTFEDAPNAENLVGLRDLLRPYAAGAVNGVERSAGEFGAYVRTSLEHWIVGSAAIAKLLCSVIAEVAEVQSWRSFPGGDKQIFEHAAGRRNLEEIAPAE